MTRLLSCSRPPASARSKLPNRVLMAPMTRSRAGRDGVPGALAPLYYAQRAGAGLIVTEATQVAPEGQGYIQTPGIHSEAQVAGWRRVTRPVHAAGGRIFLQLWHVGRVSHDPSSRTAGCRSRPRPSRSRATPGPMTGMQPFPTPRRARDRRGRRAWSRSSATARSWPGGRLRRRRDPRRQRLPDRPVPARRHQPAHRPLRRQRREPRALPAGGDRGRRRGLGSGSGRACACRRSAAFNGMSDSDPAHHLRYRGRRRWTASASPTCTWWSSSGRCS